MTISRRAIATLPLWSSLAERATARRDTKIIDLFSNEPDRLDQLCVEAAGLRCDLSRQLLSLDDLKQLTDLALASKLDDGIRNLFGGAKLNVTERRSVLHTALRDSGPSGEPVPFASEIERTRERMRKFCDAVRSGSWIGHNGKPVTDVVSIGIGGSHLGPAMVVDALAAFVNSSPRVHFVANIDPADLDAVLARCDPAQTLFIIASKTFTTLETLENARTAREWMLQSGCDESRLSSHFVAVTSNVQGANDFGIDTNAVFPMWEWVGGRFSLWSAIGLPAEIAIGSDGFDALLAGARMMDTHFRDAPVHRNMPVLLALTGIWNRNFLNYQSLAVIAYDHGLRRLPDFLQQLMMESNGKSVAVDGAAVANETCGVVWGSVGTNSQHSFHQLLHQGTSKVAVEFILPLRTHGARKTQHAQLVANCLSQSQALLLGRSEAQAFDLLVARGVQEAEAGFLAKHMQISGNRPSSTISMQCVQPESLGALLALYEHRTFCEGWLWGINSFDQYGVELGKELSRILYPILLDDRDYSGLDPSTRALVEAYRTVN